MWDILNTSELPYRLKTFLFGNEKQNLHDYVAEV